MTTMKFNVPRINANEDEAVLVEILVSLGDEVEVGQPIAVLETTKAAVDVNSEAAGVVVRFFAEQGDMVTAGTALYELEGSFETSTEEEADAGSGKTPEPQGPAITTKARLSARALGVDVEALAVSLGRKVLVADVEAAAGEPGKIETGGRKSVVVVGGGGHAATLIDALSGLDFDIIGCVDDHKTVGEHVCNGIKIIGGNGDLAKILKDGTPCAVIGVGGATSSDARAGVYTDLKGMGFELPAVISRHAYVSDSAVIDEATVVLAGAVVGPRTVVGKNCIINNNVTICHDSVVEDHAHLTPNAVVAGGCHIGERSIIGMCATILFGVRVGKDCLVHNNSSVVSDLADGAEHKNK